MFWNFRIANFGTNEKNAILSCGKLAPDVFHKTGHSEEIEQWIKNQNTVFEI